MIRFLVRVELHDADDGEDTYEHLHNEMAAEFFKKTISVNNKLMELPPAEYIFRGTDTATTEGIYARAKRAADRALTNAGLSSNPAIVVARIVGPLSVSGLSEAE